MYVYCTWSPLNASAGNSCPLTSFVLLQILRQIVSWHDSRVKMIFKENTLTPKHVFNASPLNLVTSPFLDPTELSYITSLIIARRNAVWSLGWCELIALVHDELLENRFVRANYFPGKYPLPSVVLWPRGLTANQPAVNETGTKLSLANVFEDPPSKISWQPATHRLFGNMIRLQWYMFLRGVSFSWQIQLPAKMLLLRQANKWRGDGAGGGRSWVISDTEWSTIFQPPPMGECHNGKKLRRMCRF